MQKLRKMQSNVKFRRIFRIHRITNEEEHLKYMQAVEMESYGDIYQIDTLQRSSETQQ